MENSELEFEEDKMKRQEFLDLIKLSLEQEYNAPQKQANPEQVDKRMLEAKFKKIINQFLHKNKMSYSEAINFLLSKLEVSRKVSPENKGEYDVLEEVLSNMNNSEKDIDL